jgi:methionyl-tRNA formyltransferase
VIINNSKLRIVFMGTPDFAVVSLDILIRNGYHVVGVITATDKLGGRGNKQLLQSPVKQYALKHGLPVLQPEKLKNPTFIADLKAWKADLQIVVAFRMLPEMVWNMPPLGTVNVHGSLLPKYRGAAPIHWAVTNGEKETGVTTFLLKHEIDTGDILLSKKMGIAEHDTTGDVHDRMMYLGAEALLESVQKIEMGNVQLLPQPDVEATHAPKLFHEMCGIDFNKPVSEVHNFIRGLSPNPTAWMMLNDLKLKVYKSSKEKIAPSEPAGQLISDNKKFVKVSCQDGYIHFLELQLEGRKRMDVKTFLNGYKI